MVSIGRCFEKSSNTVNNPFGRICLPWKIENVNLKLFNIINKINVLKKLMKHNSSELLSNFVGRKCNSIQKQNDRECLWQYKKPVKHGICKQDYIWNPSICTYVFHKDCQIGEYLENCACIKSHVCNLINDETLDTMELKSIDSNDKKGYWPIFYVLLVVTCLLLLIAIAY